MHRIDDSRFLLYIEPAAQEKAAVPIDDHLTMVMQLALTMAKKGIANYSDVDEVPEFREKEMYRGNHTTACGHYSDSQDYLLINQMITNSLAPYYLRWYRNSIPESEMKKVQQLYEHYVQLRLVPDIQDNPEYFKNKDNPDGDMLASDDQVKWNEGIPGQPGIDNVPDPFE